MSDTPTPSAMDFAAAIPIDPRHLRAVRLFAPDNDIRYYLNGVLVHVLADGAVRLVATNGSAIAITHTPMTDLFQPPPCKLIIPIDIVKLIAARESVTSIRVTTLDGKSYKIETVGLSINFDPIEGKFPDYERVVPRAISGETAQFDPVLLAKFGKAATSYHGKDNGGIRIEYNGESAALVHVNEDEFVGICMPWRVAGRTGLPAWIKPGRILADDDESDGPQDGLPGIKTADEIKAEATDKPLATVE